MEDRRNQLRDGQPFSWRMIGSEKAQILYGGRAVYVAVGKDFRKLKTAIDGGDPYAAQLAMAKITGHFKHGNEARGLKG
jgi:hypothetical protein